MKAVCFGSLNIDHTYRVEHFVGKGETISSSQLQDFPGGKGLNQAVALSKAGVNTVHAGIVGRDGKSLIDTLANANVDISMIKIDNEIPTGHAIIQIDDTGDNCILLYGGANQTITKDYVDSVIQRMKKGDYLILQNEINCVPYIVNAAKEKGIYVIFNPSPMDEKVFKVDLDKIDLFILNEVEAAQILGTDYDSYDEMINALTAKFPKSEVMLTLGSEGSVYRFKDTVIRQEVIKTKVVDTTAAGDTFLGYFVAGKINGMNIKENMERASMAASIAISKKGASVSIPELSEVTKNSYNY